MHTETPSVKKHLMISIIESLVAGFIAAVALAGVILFIS